MLIPGLNSRGFRIIGDRKLKYQPVDAICQFIYKGYLVSVSTAGISEGGCQNEIAVFANAENDYSNEIGLFHTVEEAIDFITKEMGNGK